MKFELLIPFVVVDGSVAYKIISTNSNNLSYQPLINKNVLRWAIKKGLFGNMRIIRLAELFGLVKIFNRGNILMANRFY